MTKDEIISMAREAGIRAGPEEYRMLGDVCSIHSLEQFAALVEAKEREACARLCDAEVEESGKGAGHCLNGIVGLLAQSDLSGRGVAAMKLAVAIRARSKP